MKSVSKSARRIRMILGPIRSAGNSPFAMRLRMVLTWTLAIAADSAIGSNSFGFGWLVISLFDTVKLPFVPVELTGK